MGNHDTYPQDIIKFDYPRENEAINAWSPSWLQFLDTPEAEQTFLDYGYYSQTFKNKDGTPFGDGKTKIIALNTNFCYNMNFEVFAQFKDPGNMLQWLQKELSELEQIGGRALLIAHVPNINQCSSQFGRRFHAILDRFQTVIRSGFYSHTHKEQV